MSENKLNRRELIKRLGVVSGAGILASSNTLAGAAGTVTPSQVKGPFYPIVDQHDTDLDLTMVAGKSERAKGEVVLVQGKVFDEDGAPVNNAVVDVWQANSDGRYSHEGDRNTAPLDPNFQGWGIVKTDATGRYQFKTIVPGPYPLSFLQASGMRCRHIHFKVSAENAKTLITQMYFAGDPLIADDLEIAKVAKEQQSLLIAESMIDEESGLPRYQFNLTLAKA